MSLKHVNAGAILALTTGAGITIGTNVDICGIYLGSVAGTVTIKSGTTTMIETIASVDFYPPLALTNGVITATSSACSFYVSYVPR